MRQFSIFLPSWLTSSSTSISWQDKKNDYSCLAFREMLLSPLITAFFIMYFSALGYESSVLCKSNTSGQALFSLPFLFLLHSSFLFPNLPHQSIKIDLEKFGAGLLHYCTHAAQPSRWGENQTCYLSFFLQSYHVRTGLNVVLHAAATVEESQQLELAARVPQITTIRGTNVDNSPEINFRFLVNFNWAI